MCNILNLLSANIYIQKNKLTKLDDDRFSVSKIYEEIAARLYNTETKYDNNSPIDFKNNYTFKNNVKRNDLVLTNSKKFNRLFNIDKIVVFFHQFNKKQPEDNNISLLMEIDRTTLPRLKRYCYYYEPRTQWKVSCNNLLQNVLYNKLYKYRYKYNYTEEVNKKVNKIYNQVGLKYFQEKQLNNDPIENIYTKLVSMTLMNKTISNILNLEIEEKLLFSDKENK